MTSVPSLRRLAALLVIFLVCALYLADLTGMGVVQPDEPRYADVGRAMAQSGDWITPHLWGQPWFEKPALLYWMTAIGFWLGLGPDLAPRLPLAILSVLFLGFFWWRLQFEWGSGPARYATAMLATSAGWLAYSHVAVTDIPMAAFFSSALLMSLGWVARADRSGLPAAAVFLALSTLAKGLVPVVLFLPVLAMPVFHGKWRQLRDWLRPGPLFAFLVCALPWYVLCTIRNGSHFLRVFFLEQHLGRFRTAALEHAQPPWFYIPVFLVLLFPWFPLLAIPAIAWPAGLRRDVRVQTLAAVVLFGFVFFSASVNKLYGYLIPLLPAAFVLLGLGLSRAARPARAVIAPVMLLGAIPLASEIAPRVMASHGIASASIPWIRVLVWLVAAGALGWIISRFAPRQAFAAAASLAALAFLWFQFATFPQFDALASARPVWLASHPPCAPPLTRDKLYGLYYYAGRILPPCPVLDPGGIRVVR